MKEPAAVAVLTVFFLGVAGCATVPEDRLKGAVIGKGVQGAVLGGLHGALIGGTVGHYTVDREADAATTAQRYEYEPEEGTPIVAIEGTSTVPKEVRAGEKIELQSTYAMLAPDAQALVKVIETFEIRHNGLIVGKPQATVTHAAGTYETSLPIILPPDAKKGIYLVTTTVRTNLSYDIRITSFEVR